MTAKNDGHSNLNLTQTPEENLAAKDGNHGVSRRSLLKGAAVAGASLATVSGLAIATQHSDALAANNNPLVETVSSGTLREYWVQVDSYLHNLVPTGYDGLMGMKFKPKDSSFWALGYRAYTPGWGHPLAGNNDIGTNNGIPGPVFRGKVGDTIRVHFRNNDTHYRYPHSMHPHGVSYTPENDGGWFAADPRPGTIIEVGKSYTYEWHVYPNSVGTWIYHDHSLPSGSNMIMEYGAEVGMFGFLVLTDSRVEPVDVEHFTFFHDMYQDDIPSLSQDYDCFNGYSFVGNTQTLQARVGNRVRWHLGALGKEFHVFHLHGHRWAMKGDYVDTVHLGPSMATSFEFVEDNPGKWLFHCHVSDHMMGGMSGLYVVTQ
jgi:FtsP/CotA-like multicopper oxidase with cupredoxin domain